MTTSKGTSEDLYNVEVRTSPVLRCFLNTPSEGRTVDVLTSIVHPHFYLQINMIALRMVRTLKSENGRLTQNIVLGISIYTKLLRSTLPGHPKSDPDLEIRNEIWHCDFSSFWGPSKVLLNIKECRTFCINLCL